MRTTANSQSASSTANKPKDVKKKKPASPSWILPVSLIGGIFLIGGIAYFSLRKK